MSRENWSGPSFEAALEKATEKAFAVKETRAMFGGRPSTYDPKYCAEVIALGEQGKSEVQIAVAIGVPRTTLRSWADEHKCFRQALTRAKEASQAWWEEAAQSGHVGQVINPAVWKHTVTCRFAGDYNPPQRSEHSGPDGKPIQTEEVGARDALARQLARQAAGGAEGGGTGEPDGEAG